MATNTYVALDKVTASGSVASVTLNMGSTISQTYTDLIIVANVQQVTDGEDLAIQFNGDTGANYSRTYMCGDGSTAHSGRSTNSNYVVVDHHATPPTGTSFSENIIQIQNYSNTTTYKSVLARSNSQSTYAGTVAVAGLWRNTAAITSITIFCTNGSNIKTGSTFSLYGITAEPVGTTPKATGGTVTSDSTYWYHTFTNTGYFIPNQSLTCDYLVIAGGGGGGNTFGGGGGAGGLRSTVGTTGGGGTLESAISVTAQSYTITIGAGGAGGTVSGNRQGSSGTTSTFSTITSTGGGGGAFDTAGQNGGSGGGGATGSAGTLTTAGGTGTTNQGYGGGRSDGNRISGGGGGGAGVAGSDGVAGTGGGGNGGNGVSISALATVTGTGVSNFYAGGGGGGTLSTYTTAGSGGSGGGGAGGKTGMGTNGTVSTGSGGGGGGYTNTEFNGGNGGSGIVIIRYAK